MLSIVKLDSLHATLIHMWYTCNPITQTAQSPRPFGDKSQIYGS